VWLLSSTQTNQRRITPPDLKTKLSLELQPQKLGQKTNKNHRTTNHIEVLKTKDKGKNTGRQLERKTCITYRKTMI
jgi:hypothetical protein